MTVSGIGQSMSAFLLYGMQNTQQPTADDIASQIINQLDTNGDGQLSTDEIDASGNTNFASQLLKADANGDGIVTKDELSDAIAKNMASHRGHMHHHGGANMAINLLNELDTNGDGSSSTSATSNSQSTLQSLLSADTNGNGVMSLADLAAYLANNTATSSSGSNTQSILSTLA
jgi:Ca2+-binding EF-hand superfamily protein